MTPLVLPEVVRESLRWDPSSRKSMARLCLSAWFQEGDADATTPQDQSRDAEPALEASARASSGASTPRAASVPQDASASGSGPGGIGEDFSQAGVEDGSASNVWSRRVEAWLTPYRPPVATTPGKMCACSGNCCVHKHRAEGKCTCEELVDGSPLCITCKCVVSGCRSPKLKSKFCCRHLRVFKEAPFITQLAAAAVPIVTEMVPSDVVDFLTLSAELRSDFAMLILAAAVKEPLPIHALVEGWRQLDPQYSSEDLRSVALRAVVAAHGAPHRAQLEQLHRQGVGRNLGLARIAQNLGVIKKIDPVSTSIPGRSLDARPREASESNTYSLGTDLLKYVAVGADEYGGNDRCAAFLEAARAEQGRLQERHLGSNEDAVDYAEELRGALQRVASKSGAIPTKGGDGYCMDFLTRKMLLARMIDDLSLIHI